MLRVVLFLGLVTFTLAMECGPLQKMKVKDQWAEAYGTGHERVELATKAFKIFFKKHPQAVGYFSAVNGNNVYSAEFSAHMSRILASWDMLISVLGEEEVLQDQLDHLRQQHADRDIANNFYDEFAKILLDVVSDKVSGRLDKPAFVACGKILVDGIKQPVAAESGDGAEDAKDVKEDAENAIEKTP